MAKRRDASLPEMPEAETPRRPQQRRPRRAITIAALLSTFTIAAVLLAGLRYSPHVAPLISGPAAGSIAIPAPTDGNTNVLIQLHPQEHAFRPATTIKQRWRVTTGLRRPDGVLKRVYLINDAFPGPVLEARSGDRLIIEVENALLESKEGVALHWHGLSMRGANDQDGAAGVTQKPIAAGSSLTYDFTIGVGQHGTFWYHAHDGVQRADGLFGGLVVHEPAHDLSEGAVNEEYLLMVGDWYHRPAKDALEFYMHPGSFGNELVPDNLLLNAVGAFDCSNAVPARPLDCGPAERPILRLDESDQTLLRVINVGAYAGVSLAFTGAQLRLSAADGGNALQEQYASSAGVLHPGERLDVFVWRAQSGTRAEQEPTELVISLDTTPFKYPNSALTSKQRFTLAWEGTAGNGGREAGELPGHFDLADSKALQLDTNTVPTKANLTILLYAITQKLTRLENVPHGFINNTFWQPQATPPEPLVNLDREQWDKNQLVPHIPYDADAPIWVDIVLNNLDEEGHPFHLHGYDFWVLATYSSTFNWGSYNPWTDPRPSGGDYNFVDPVKKDTVLVPRRGYAVLRLRADNPGIWMFHCHVLWHQAAGMAMAFQVGD